MNNIEFFLAGATTVAALVIAMFFWRFRRSTGERLFAFFSVAFVLLGLERICTPFLSPDPHSALYAIRLAAFLLILWAVFDKNRAAKKRN